MGQYGLQASQDPKALHKKVTGQCWSRVSPPSSPFTTSN